MHYLTCTEIQKASCELQWSAGRTGAEADASTSTLPGKQEQLSQILAGEVRLPAA